MMNFKAVGFDDADFFMQGSAVSGVKYADDIALDARRGIYPSDYGIAIVIPKILQRANELGINVLKGGELSADYIARLGLSDAQDILTKASKGGIQVNFKVYRSIVGQQPFDDYAEAVSFLNEYYRPKAGRCVLNLSTEIVNGNFARSYGESSGSAPKRQATQYHW